MSRDVDADLTAGEPQKHREHVKTLLDVLGSTKGGDTARLAAAREAQRVVEKIGAGGVRPLEGGALEEALGEQASLETRPAQHRVA